MLALVSQVLFQGIGIGQWAIYIVIVAAIIAVVYVALKKFEITIPDWVVKIFWIVVVAVVAIAAIKFLMTI